MRHSYRHYREARTHYDQMDTFSTTHEGVVYHCPLDKKKRINLARQSVNKQFLPWLELANPHIVHVGVTTYCNLSCPACPVGIGELGRPSEHLKFDTYCKMVDELRGSLLFLLFWDWGEPFLHPHLFEMISHANKSQIRTVTSTNLSMKLTDVKIEEIITSGLDHLIVCIDGIDQTAHQAYRRGSRLHQLLENLEGIVSAKTRSNSLYPMIEIRTLATRQNEKQFSRILQLAEEIGAQMYSVKNVRPFDFRGRNLDHEIVPKNPALARYDYTDETSPDPQNRLPGTGKFNCGKPFYAPTLNSDGNLVFCSYVDRDEEIYGDISKSFSKIWKHKSSRRKRMIFGRLEGTQTCEKCFFRVVHRPTVPCTVPLDDFPPGLSLENKLTKEEFLTLVEQVRPSSV